MSGAEIWVRGMVSDGFAFVLMAGGDPRRPGDYNIFKAASDRRPDQSAELIAALRARSSCQVVRRSPQPRLVLT